MDIDIEIKKLTPYLPEDYLRFFDNDHAGHLQADRCYCISWCSEDNHKLDGMQYPENRREYAIQCINNGVLQGYLAYHEGRAVGWCNANTKSECLNCYGWHITFTDGKTLEKAGDIPQGAKIKSVYCFAIAQDMKRKGVASKLLERVCTDAAKDGFDYVEAYTNTNKKFINDFDDCRGHREMYEKHGFKKHKKIKNILIMRKPLK